MKDSEPTENAKPADSGISAESPCVNVCVLNAERICIGCFRSSQEIAAWSQMDVSAKRNVNQNCLLRREDA